MIISVMIYRDMNFLVLPIPTCSCWCLLQGKLLMLKITTMQWPPIAAIAMACMHASIHVAMHGYAIGQVNKLLNLVTLRWFSRPPHTAMLTLATVLNLLIFLTKLHLAWSLLCHQFLKLHADWIPSRERPTPTKRFIPLSMR